MNSNKGKQKFFVIYQITNLLDNRIYVGLHSTYNINDKYMGSSKHLKKDLKELGRQNFIKEILHVFNNKEDMIKMEAEIVTKNFCHRIDTYNRMVGGINDGLTIDMVSVVDKDGNNLRVYRDDPRYISGELISVAKGMATVKDENNNIFNVSITDARYLSGEFTGVAKNTVIVRNKEGNIFRVSKNDSKFLSGELVSSLKGQTQHVNSSRLNTNHSKESKEKIGLANSIKQKGEGNSQFGTCWINKEDINKKIQKENLDEYTNQGWIKGRKLSK